MPSESAKKQKKPSEKPRPCLRRRATKADNIAVADWPISEEELTARQHLYFEMTPSEFARAFSDCWDRPATLLLDGETYSLQVNFCTNPLCEHFGLPQEEFSDVTGTPSRYNLKGTGGAEQHNSRIKCIGIPGHRNGLCLGNTSDTLSNWSAAEEIARLATIGRVVHPEPVYEFHTAGCKAQEKSPLTMSPKERKKFFHKRGRTTANCTKYQCTACGKITAVLPPVRSNLTYLQKKSELNIRFAEMLVNKTAIIRSGEMLHLSPSTYYAKLKWLYLRCLEFLDRYERQGFERITLDEAWLNVDSLVYRLNQSRRRGMARGRSKYPVDAPWLQTHLVTVAETKALYCLRADLAYDSEADLDQIDRDTVAYRDEHLHNFCRKNDRYEHWSVTPQPPADNDPQTESAYREELKEVETRKRYVEGLHTNPTYTALASLWLVKRMLKAKKWRIVTDDDSAFLSAIPRAFVQEIRDKTAHLFVCKIQQRTKKVPKKAAEAEVEAGDEAPSGDEGASTPVKPEFDYIKADRRTKFIQYLDSRRQLTTWAQNHGYTTDRKEEAKENFLSFHDVARLRLLEQFASDPKWAEKLYIMGETLGRRHPKSGKAFDHPLPDKSEGQRKVICKTDLTACTPEEAADLIMGVDFHAINSIFNSVRRRVFLIERPITGTSASSGTGRTYLYSNRNPQVMTMVLTVFRLWWNFIHKGDKDRKTPAMRMGLVDKPFTWRDVVYFRGQAGVTVTGNQPPTQADRAPVAPVVKARPVLAQRLVTRPQPPPLLVRAAGQEQPVEVAGTLGIAASVDVETTGRSSKDEIIELGIVLFTFDRETNRVVEVIDTYTGQREPSCPIHPKAAEVHGISPQMLRGKKLDDERVGQLLSQAEFIVAHNAAFDRRYVTALYPSAGEKRWFCSMSGIDWTAYGQESKRLRELLWNHGIKMEASHRAGDDALAVVRLLSCLSRDGKTYLCKLVS